MMQQPETPETRSENAEIQSQDDGEDYAPRRNVIPIMIALCVASFLAILDISFVTTISALQGFSNQLLMGWFVLPRNPVRFGSVLGQGKRHFWTQANYVAGNVRLFHWKLSLCRSK
jgi:hypothetical protein